MLKSLFKFRSIIPSRQEQTQSKIDNQNHWQNLQKVIKKRQDLHHLFFDPWIGGRI